MLGAGYGQLIWTSLGAPPCLRASDGPDEKQVFSFVMPIKALNDLLVYVYAADLTSWRELVSMFFSGSPHDVMLKLR